MSDLISREALKKAIKSNCDLCHDKNTIWCEHCCPLNDFEDLIDNAPTVAERPQGEWIDVVNSEYPSVWHYECSECHGRPLCTPFVGEDFLSNFCPNCGAKMKGGAE